MEERGSWKIKNSTIAYDNPWITVHHDEVLTPANTDGIYGRVHFKNHAIGIIPISDDGYTWIVGQHRYPLDVYSWEIPQGGGLEGTPYVDSAKRELKEETGLTAKHWEEILHLDLSNSVSDEQGTVFVAKGLTLGEWEPEETEDLQLKKIKLGELFEMVLTGEITDGVTVAGVLKLFALMKRRK